MIMFDVVVNPIIYNARHNPQHLLGIPLHITFGFGCTMTQSWEIGSLWTTLPNGNLGIPKTMGVNTRML